MNGSWLLAVVGQLGFAYNGSELRIALLCAYKPRPDYDREREYNNRWRQELRRKARDARLALASGC